MCFHMYNDKVSSLKEFVVQKLTGKLTYKKFWALQDISFSVAKGEIIGIIGQNGAGKSTLLKIISKILKPTKGKIYCEGNIVPMLELGSGFDLDLTGKENIFLNGAVLGFSKKFMHNKVQEIVDFSELEKFINVPIRNYSSGMLMRLAFSIATVINPSILIVDEILGVGDLNFQNKSRSRMLEMMSGGTTVLFVSHDIDQIQQMCDRVIWLDQGKIISIGEPKKICSQYKMSNPI